MSGNGRSLTAAELEQRRDASMRHGAYSDARVRGKARYVKQSLLQPLGLRQGDLGRLARAYLDIYARAAAKLSLYDDWAADHGFLSADGSSPPWIKEYYACLNATRLALRELERHLREHERVAGESSLESYLAANYPRPAIEGPTS